MIEAEYEEADRFTARTFEKIVYPSLILPVSYDAEGRKVFWELGD